MTLISSTLVFQSSVEGSITLSLCYIKAFPQQN